MRLRRPCLLHVGLGAEAKVDRSALLDTGETEGERREVVEAAATLRGRRLTVVLPIDRLACREDAVGMVRVPFEHAVECVPHLVRHAQRRGPRVDDGTTRVAPVQAGRAEVVGGVRAARGGTGGPDGAVEMGAVGLERWHLGRPPPLLCCPSLFDQRHQVPRLVLPHHTAGRLCPGRPDGQCGTVRVQRRRQAKREQQLRSRAGLDEPLQERRLYVGEFGERQAEDWSENEEGVRPMNRSGIGNGAE